MAGVTSHRVIVVGDSVPRGYGTTQPFGWPMVLGDYTDDAVEAYELGITGERLVNVPNRAVEEVEPRVADTAGWETVVLIHSGHNDALGDPVTEPQMFETIVRRLDGLLDGVDGIDRHVFIGLVEAVRGRTITVSADAQQRVRTYDTLLEDTVQDSRYVGLREINWSAHSVDGVHPTNEGQRLVAKRVANAVL